MILHSYTIEAIISRLIETGPTEKRGDFTLTSHKSSMLSFIKTLTDRYGFYTMKKALIILGYL